MKFSHEELKDGAGLDHGTGAICCGCDKCNCFACYVENYITRNKRCAMSK